MEAARARDIREREVAALLKANDLKQVKLGLQIKPWYKQ